MYYCMKCKFMNPDYEKGIYDIESVDMEELFGHPVDDLEKVIKEVIDSPNYFPM